MSPVKMPKRTPLLRKAMNQAAKPDEVRRALKAGPDWKMFGKKWQAATEDDLINRIQDIRTQNNKLWMSLLRLAMKYAPQAAKKILAEITVNDRAVSRLTARLARGGNKKTKIKNKEHKSVLHQDALTGAI